MYSVCYVEAKLTWDVFSGYGIGKLKSSQRLELSRAVELIEILILGICVLFIDLQMRDGILLCVMNMWH